jgi:hypothetical protein
VITSFSTTTLALGTSITTTVSGASFDATAALAWPPVNWGLLP